MPLSLCYHLLQMFYYCRSLRLCSSLQSHITVTSAMNLYAETLLCPQVQSINGVGMATAAFFVLFYPLLKEKTFAISLFMRAGTELIKEHLQLN